MPTIEELVKDEGLVADSFERVKADLAALAVEDLDQVNLDIQIATRTVLGALPEIRALRDRMVKELPALDITAFDKLQDYTQALRYAQAGYQIATQPEDDQDALMEAGGKLKDRILADAKSLAAYGLFDAGTLAKLKGGQGLNNLAEDLDILCQAMTDSWPKIQAKALTPQSDIQLALRIGLRLTRIAGLRDQGPARLAAATELRMRAFTLFVRTYDETRDAVGYLRRKQEDLENIAPTLYSGKGRRKVAEPAPPSNPNAPNDATGAPAPSHPAGADTAGNTAAPVTTPAATNGAAIAPAVRDPYLPG